jgi:hypothetical protein
MMQGSQRPEAFVYSVVRAMPNPRRGECVNLGVIVIAPDGTYSDARFGNLTRVRRLDSHADLDSIRSFLGGITAALPLHGSQTYIGRRDPPLAVDTLAMWSKEFGGAVRVTEPRSALATNPSELLDQLFRDYVSEAKPEQQAMAVDVERTPTRTELLTGFDRSVAHWTDRPVRALPGTTVRGYRAHHHVDRVLEVEPTVPVAVLEAINFGAKELAEVYGRRATICLAAEDLHEAPETRDIVAYALHSAAPHDRLEALQESAELFRAKGVVPVLFSNLEPIRQFVEQGLPLE